MELVNFKPEKVLEVLVELLKQQEEFTVDYEIVKKPEKDKAAG